MQTSDRGPISHILVRTDLQCGRDGGAGHGTKLEVLLPLDVWYVVSTLAGFLHTAMPSKQETKVVSCSSVVTGGVWVYASCECSECL